MPPVRHETRTYLVRQQYDRFIPVRRSPDAGLLFPSSARTPANSPRASLTYRDKLRSLDHTFEGDENDNDAPIPARKRDSERVIMRSRFLPSPTSDGPYRTALSSVFLPTLRSCAYVQHATRQASAMLFSAKPYLLPESHAWKAAQHIKAFCGRSLPIGSNSEAQRDISGTLDLLEQFKSPVDGLIARRKSGSYSKLAIVALNARGLSRIHTINSLSWSTPSGAARPLLATLLSSPGGAFHTWDPQSQAVETIRPACHVPASGSDAMLTAISWRAGGSEIATGSKAGVVSLFDMGKGACGVHLRPHPPSTSRFHVSSLSWSGTDLLASAFSSGHLLISDIRCPTDTRLIAEPASWSGCPGQEARRGAGGLSVVEWDPCSNGIQLAAGSDTGLVRIWDIRKGDRPVVSQRTRFAEIRSLAWSPSASGLLAFTGPTTQSSTAHGRGMSMSAGGVPECTGFLKLEKLSRAAQVEYLDTSPTRIDRLLWARDSPVLIACTSPEDLASYNSAPARADGVSPPRSNVDPGSPVSGSSRATPAPSHPIVFFSYPSMRQIAQLDGHARSIRHAALSNDGQTLVTGGLEEVLRVWEVPDFIGNRAKGRGGAETHVARAERPSTIR